MQVKVFQISVLPPVSLSDLCKDMIPLNKFVSPSAFLRRAVVSYWQKYVHEVLVNRLGLSLPRKSVVRLTDRPDMTLDVYRGRKTTMQQQQHNKFLCVWFQHPLSFVQLTIILISDLFAVCRCL